MTYVRVAQSSARRRPRNLYRLLPVAPTEWVAFRSLAKYGSDLVFLVGLPGFEPGTS